MLIFVFFSVCIQSLAFYVGNVEGLIGQELIVTFALYPTDIFRGMTKVFLFTVLPAGFISYMPLGLLRQVQPLFFGAALGVTTLLLFGGTALFYHGLKRYGSGEYDGNAHVGALERYFLEILYLYFLFVLQTGLNCVNSIHVTNRWKKHAHWLR
jgi:hypothetical protein